MPAQCNKKQIIFPDKWISSIYPQEMQRYKTDFKTYLSSLERINNDIKHNNCRLSFVKIKMSYFSALGFYLESYIGGGVHPNIEVHPKYNGMNTAFSYNYFLSLVMVSLYFLAQSTSNFIRGIIGDINLPNKIFDESLEIKELFSSIENFFSKIIFIDEYCKDFPKVVYGNGSLKVEYPADKRYINRFVPYSSATYEVKFLTSGDGITCDFALPYF